VARRNAATSSQNSRDFGWFTYFLQCIATARHFGIEIKVPQEEQAWRKQWQNDIGQWTSDVLPSHRVYLPSSTKEKHKHGTQTAGHRGYPVDPAIQDHKMTPVMME
jgi:hypothetical protein